MVSCGWSAGFEWSDLNGPAYASAVFDDGSGPALYVGGAFSTAGGTDAHSIARWDGHQWSPLAGPQGQGVFGADNSVSALAVFDDGGGPALYIGGSFNEVGGVVASGVARWDGHTWSALPGAPTNGNYGKVFALAVFDDGTGPGLYAAGEFSQVGSFSASNIARWNGSTWSPLAGPQGTGTNARILSLAVFDDGSGASLYAGGYFETAGGVRVNGIAKWNGAQWSALAGPGGPGMSNTLVVTALAVFEDNDGPALFAGGHFSTAGGVAVNNIAKWNGISWSAVSGPGGTGVEGAVYDLATFESGMGSLLAVGGAFTSAGGRPATNLALWNGHDWSAVAGVSGEGTDSTVTMLEVQDGATGPTLFVSGRFRHAGGLAVNYIAAWDVSNWFSLSGASGLGLNNPVMDFEIYDDGSGPALYVGGYFREAGEVPLSGVARWNGNTWSPLTGSSGPLSYALIDSLALFDPGDGPQLWAQGMLQVPGGVTTSGALASWDGFSWSAPPHPPAGLITKVAVLDNQAGPAVYVLGAFRFWGNTPANGIVKWDGSSWTVLAGPNGTGVDGTVWAIASFDDGSGPALYVAGNFSTAGGIPANNIAKWDGSNWSALAVPEGNGLDDWVLALATYRDSKGSALYAGGRFLHAGGVSAHRVARWDGRGWSVVDGPSGLGFDDSVYTLASLDDGAGPQLYAGGDFRSAGGEKVNRIARWNGSAWTPLTGPFGVGVSNAVHAIAAFDDGNGMAIYAGGSFSAAGGLPSRGIARWSCRSIFSFADGLESGDLAAWSHHSPEGNDASWSTGRWSLRKTPGAVEAHVTPGRSH